MSRDYSPRSDDAVSVYIHYTRRDGMPTYAEGYLLESGQDVGKLLIYSKRRVDDPVSIGSTLTPDNLSIYGTDLRIKPMTHAAYDRRHLLTEAGFAVMDQRPEWP